MLPAIQQQGVEIVNWEMIGAVATDPDMTKIWVNGIGDYNSLDEMEKAQFVFLAGSLGRIQENIFLQYQAGRLEYTIWDPYLIALGSLANSSGLREYIKARQSFHTKAWVELISNQQKEKMTMPEMYTASIS